MKFRVLCLFVLALLAACSSAPATTFESLPPGDAGRGAQLFAESVNGAPTCASCHTVDGQPLVGPSLQGYAARAGSQVEGETAQQYTYISIIQPAAHVVSSFANTMYTQYGRQLSAQQTADLIAYLLTL